MKSKDLKFKVKVSAAVISLIFGLSGAAISQETSASGTTNNNSNDVVISLKDLPKVGGTIQMIGAVEYLEAKHNTPVAPNERDDARLYLFLKQARLNFSGTRDDIKYYVQMQFGGEEVPNGTNSVYSLLDAYVDAPILQNNLGVRFGQFKVPFSREMLSDPASLQFGDTSINTTAFNIQRDVGIAFHGATSNIYWALGTFSGGGIDIPQRYIPQSLGIPQLVARIGYDTLDKDVFSARQSDNNRKGTGFAAYVSGSYEKNSSVGHGQVFTTKKTDTSWFKNAGWNPYLSQTDIEALNDASLVQYEADVAYQTEFSGLKFFVAAEANYGKYDSQAGSLTLKGGQTQFSITYAPVEIALRYAVIIPDEELAYKATTTGTGLKPAGIYPIFTDNKPVHQINPALNFYLTKNLTVKMDLDIMIDAPVAHEDLSGAYNLMIMQGQTSYAQRTATVLERQNAYTARMVAQFVF
jgi:hypothetical protein